MPNPYKVGDLVELVSDDHLSMTAPKAGEWGKVFEVLGSRVDIQLAGYSRPKDAFFQSTRQPYYNLKPHTD